MSNNGKKFAMMSAGVIDDILQNSARRPNCLFNQFGDTNPQPIDGISLSGWNGNAIKAYLALNDMRFKHHAINKKIHLISARCGINDVEETKKSLLELCLLGHLVIQCPFDFDDELRLQLTSYREQRDESVFMELTHFDVSQVQLWNSHFKTDIVDRYRQLTAKKDEKVLSFDEQFKNSNFAQSLMDDMAMRVSEDRFNSVFSEESLKGRRYGN